MKMFEKNKFGKHVITLILLLFINGVENCYSTQATNLETTENIKSTTTEKTTTTIVTIQNNAGITLMTSKKATEKATKIKFSRPHSRKTNTKSTTTTTSLLQYIFKTQCYIAQADSKLFR